jgi:hypothetical protein
MRKVMLPLILLLFFISFTENVDINLDFSCGAVVDKDVFIFDTYYPENESFKTINIGINYQFWKYFGLGAYFGYQYNNPCTGSDIVLIKYPVNYGIKAIFGNINKGLAGFINIGNIPEVGIYIKNVIFDIGIGHGATQYTENIDLYGNTINENTKHYFSPYIGIGYSIPVKK